MLVETETIGHSPSAEVGGRPSEVLDSYEGLVVVSSGKEGDDIKGQDRALTLVIDDGRPSRKLMAIVCDGVAQSPNSAMAAEYVSARLSVLYQPDGIREAAKGLLERRSALVNSPLTLEPDLSSVLKEILEEIVLKKRERSFQTTFISAAIERDEGPGKSGVRIRILGCGDSCVLVFTHSGNLLYCSLGAWSEDEVFEHLSLATDALPDSFDEGDGSVLDYTRSFEDEVHLLLCSDGFYDCFDTFRDIFVWLNDNLEEIRSRDCESDLLAKLHAELSRRRGDDDISFVWLRPPRSFSKPEDTHSSDVPGQNAESSHETEIRLEFDLPTRGVLNKIRRFLSPKTA